MKEKVEGEERRMGPDHILTLTCMSNLGLLLINNGKYKEAEALRRVELVRWERAFGPDHKGHAKCPW